MANKYTMPVDRVIARFALLGCRAEIARTGDALNVYVPINHPSKLGSYTPHVATPIRDGMANHVSVHKFTQRLLQQGTTQP